MTNPPNIDAIIAELSEAAGPSRELDARIAVACGILFVGPEEFPGGGYVYYRKDADGSESWPGQSGDQLVRLYTASLDAAMTLAEPNWWLQCGGPLSPAAYGYSREEDRKPRAGFQMIGPPYSSGAQAATLPLAICIAALRVRSALIGEVGRDG
jgi:hypothetical protein